MTKKQCQKKLDAVEKKFALAVEKMEALEHQAYDLRVLLYRFDGRCYPCETHGGREPGDCSS